MAAARLHGIPVVLARRGMRWSSDDGVMLDILAPSLPMLADTGDDVNENSIVMMLHYGGVDTTHSDIQRRPRLKLGMSSGADVQRTDRCGATFLVDGLQATMLPCVATPRGRR